MCFCVDSSQRRVACGAVNVLASRPVTLQEKSRALQAIASGSPDAVPVTFRCGCKIAPYRRQEGGTQVAAVKMFHPLGPNREEVLALKGLLDFRSLLEGAQKASRGLFGSLSETTEDGGIPSFLEANRKYFAEYVKQKRSSLAHRNVVALGGPFTPAFGRFNYIPVQQGIASSEPHAHALECYASTLVNALMSLGLVDPTLQRVEFEQRYTYLNGLQPCSPDGVRFDPADSLTLRGIQGHNTLFGAHLANVIARFQDTDWSKLMEMDSTKATVRILDLASHSVAQAKALLDEGWGIQFRADQGTIYSDSQHFVTLRVISMPAPGAYVARFTDNDYRTGSFRSDDDTPPGPSLGGKLIRAFLAHPKP